ncbi:hypothetical protein DW641_14690 [Dorea longicatena]|uniref:Uncharacterized protein n=1 Tax=Dorea longicatena TaxID=88431 RepID=A0A414RYI2_9FIRM|nr:hypothetical protein DW641_14690 [Dorea longicatena]
MYIFFHFIRLSLLKLYIFFIGKSTFYYAIIFSLILFYIFIHCFYCISIKKRLYLIKKSNKKGDIYMDLTVKSRLLCKMLYNVFTISTYQN